MSSLKGLASIAKGLSAEPSVDLIEELETSPHSKIPGTVRLQANEKPLAKTRNQDYKRVMILVKKDTEKKAYRKWEDANPNKDFSDLVETLLSRYADGHMTT